MLTKAQRSHAFLVHSGGVLLVAVLLRAVASPTSAEEVAAPMSQLLTPEVSRTSPWATVEALGAQAAQAASGIDKHRDSELSLIRVAPSKDFGEREHRKARGGSSRRPQPHAPQLHPLEVLSDTANSYFAGFLQTAGSDDRWTWDKSCGVFIFVAFLLFSIDGVKDIHQTICHLSRTRAAAAKRSKCEVGKPHPPEPGLGGDTAPSSDKSKPAKQVEWSIFALICLTSYRFYTGFLSATWLPYLLAMQGADLWGAKQSLFMGLAKLIYGGTILLNPIFGLIGDQAVTLSHSVGRRLFVRTGVIVAALGLYICHVAAQELALLSFLGGVTVWRLGEAINDVTTEALVPELVPPSQFQLASAIKASSFLLGGLFGYVLLICLAGVHYGWLYYAYPIGMFVCVIPSLVLLEYDWPTAAKPLSNDPEHTNFFSSMSFAYIGPLRYRGGFPRACLAVFVFSLGTAPMFFLLLIVRDLVGITDLVEVQQEFSKSSIVFFLSAAGASIVAGLSGNGGSAEDKVEEALSSRAKSLVASMTAFGVLAGIVPALSLFGQVGVRIKVFYVLAGLFGASFGMAFSRFQEVTWQVLPPDADVANAMGFNVMSRLLGLGLGNFSAGLILDCFYIGGSIAGAQSTSGDNKGWKIDYSDTKLTPVYAPMGYVVMCTCCLVCVLSSSAIAYSAIGAHRSEMERLLKTRPATASNL